MTAPAGPLPDLSTAPGFPAWYQGGFVDIEKLLRAWFETMLTNVEVVAWLPPDKQLLAEIQEGTTYLRVFRSGGQVVNDLTDGPHVQFAAISKTRELSWQVTEFVRQVMLAMLENSTRVKAGGLYALVTTKRELAGPILAPETFRDPRLVPVTFELETQRRKGLPSISDYGRELIA